MNVLGTEVTQLTQADNGVFDIDPDWQPVYHFKHHTEFFNGHGFGSNVLVVIFILKPDRGIYKWNTMTDSTGSFSVNYTPNIEGTHVIFASDGTNIAYTL